MTQRLILALGIVLYACPGRAQTMDSGKQEYQSLCVGCHGDDGSGGGHGPGFLDVRQPRATSQEAVRDLILKGIPGVGMPAFKVSDQQATAIAAYVMKLKTPAGAAPSTATVSGDLAAGEQFFTGNGKCSACHMVRGGGGVLGPDLSTGDPQSRSPSGSARRTRRTWWTRRAYL
jgi:cytochrome c oxidase cbb3-type subunit 3